MTDLKRRKLIALAGVSAVVPISAILKAGTAIAADLPMVDAASPQATALKYVAASATEGQTCGNCALYQGADAEVGPCPLFAGSSVAKAGWCSAWVAKS